jgi:hypothetical protein
MSFLQNYDVWYSKYVEPGTGKIKFKAVKVKKKKKLFLKKFVHPSKIGVNPYLGWGGRN